MLVLWSILQFIYLQRVPRLSKLIAFFSDERHAKPAVKRKTEEDDEPDLNETNYDEVRGLKTIINGQVEL